jgi:4-amino-4-deoxy-L-arabinose transferase-like glycosyltransferase
MNIFNTKLFDSLIKLIEKLYYIIFIVILMVALFNIFFNLGIAPIESFDEARHGVSAYEMIKRNNYIVNTYSYNNDYWNLKPPISFWGIILGYKIAGFNPLGLRLFSGLAAMLTILIIGIFSLYKYGRLASLISTIVIATTIPYITEHCARTGDADSIYVLFFTMAIVSLALVEKNSKWIYAFGGSFALAFLSKSWHAGNIIIIGIIYLLLSKLLFKLKAKQIFLLALSVCTLIFVWIILRYMNDGIVFFKTMIEFDLMKRTSEVLEGHIGGYCFYLEGMQWSYFYWILVFAATAMSYIVIIYKFIRNKEQANNALIIGTWIMVPFFMYTMAKTKISWYILPIYPAIALSIGSTSSLLFKEKSRNWIAQIILIVMVAISIYKSEEVIISRISNPEPEINQELIKDIGNVQQYRGKRIYINHYDQSYWLSAELYDDLTPIEGGAEGFLEDNTKDSLLFITKDDANILGDKRKNLKVLLENESAYIFTK